MPFEAPEGEILLYHGTVVPHNYPSPYKGMPFTDFGRGYYLTSIPFQAQEWVKNKATDSYWVYEYKVRIPEERILLFPDYNKDWLDFIVDNRLALKTSGFNLSDYDVIIGGLADRMKDKPENPDEKSLPDFLREYRNGRRTASKTLKKIRPRKGKEMDQYCFRTEAAARLLRRVRGWRWTWTKEYGWVRSDAPMFDDKRLDLLAAMYAHITGDTEADAKARLKKTRTGQAISMGSETELYHQPTHNLAEIAEELPPDVRVKFTDEAIMEAFQAEQDRVEQRDEDEKSRRAEKDRLFAALTPEKLANDSDGDEDEDES